MAAYAALVSVMHIIEQIQHHPHPPISLDEIQIQSLTENVVFLQDFLERYPHDGSEEADELESRIADAAYAAEDVIESHIVDQITAGGSTSHGEKISSIDLHRGLQKVIEDTDFIKREVIDIIKEKRGIQDQLNRNSVPAGLLTSPPTGQNTMVGFDELLYELMDRLTGGKPGRRVIPIYGMGGIGKTTLARNTFTHETVVQHFHILAWATISQEYSMREILLQIICQENKEYRENLRDKGDYELGELLHKNLSGRKYLIVMDDMWDIDVWDKVNHFFPDNNNGSRILATTRLSNVAFQLPDDHGLEMSFLSEDESWNLLCKTAFREEGCRPELEESGKKIAKNCKGLPLSIVVIGRVLAKSNQTREYWEYIAKNLSSIVNLEDDKHCLKVLSMSYNQLPVHLKPCFLYMGVFNEDRAIHVPSLIRLWVDEGFLKPVSGKSLEAVAQEYLKDLIDRNLIFVHKWGSNGKIKFCNIHDLLRDLCLRQAQKEKFICVASQNNPNSAQGMNTQRRIALHRGTSHQALPSLQSMPLARSLICDFDGVLPSFDLRLLRILNASNTNLYLSEAKSKAEFLDSLEALFSQLINSQHLAITIRNFFWPRDSQLFPSSLNLLWNVHTLIVQHIVCFIAPPEIWKMPQLKHVKFTVLELPDPPSTHTDGRDDIILENLQTLSRIRDFRCSEEVVKRIPHIRKLQVVYSGATGWSLSSFNNLGRLNLDSLYCNFGTMYGINWSDLLQSITFPHSLKKLTLEGCRLHWVDITTKIGSLPLLEVLKLMRLSTKGHTWETVGGRFPKLKFLEIGALGNDLKCWTLTESTHFPVLEHLVLEGLRMLEEIPSELGNVPTLKMIELRDCSDSTVLSAKGILDEQQEVYGYVDLQVRVRLTKDNEELESFKSRNFQVEVARSN